MSETHSKVQTPRDGPGWTIAGILFACGIALGSIITRSPIQSRMAGPMRGKMPARGGLQMPPSLPALLPFYAAALAFPLFIWLARRLPLSRASWRTALPLWLLIVLVASVIPELVLMALFGRVVLDSMLFYILALRALNTGPLMIGVAALAHTIEQRRRTRAAALDAATARAELAQAQLRSLTGQLRPHFLFNTLQSISTLVHRDPAAADAMIGKLGDLLRASLDLGDRAFIRLEEELQLVRAYLDIMQERFGERLTVAIQSTADPDTLVPPFLLQPLVENAVQHGVEPEMGTGSVRVLARNENDALVLEVSDTGGGNAGSGGNGVGLRNTRQRLAALFEERASLSIANDGASGTRVTIRIPHVQHSHR